ncbi:MerR family transcriptional regulator [Jiangella asiatica]|uniref:MerR family transcriptional regulator n=1 Tax=Jiangella asiatica TaxID=2530372 RepID=A0A4R5CQK8_9ACTN|nr:MerR family transcriptional regulator [Jiangella asiatica]TDE01610.1 MerR family transcriptional regulator [Jiangella asiatica]
MTTLDLRESLRETTITVPTETISEVAARIGVTVHTLRYYERIGLLDVPRDSAGRRHYTPDDVDRVVFITRLRQTDMPIRDIQRYFELADAGPSTEPDRLELLEKHREAVRVRMEALRIALDVVDFKIAKYGGTARP